jgi:RNA polymerase sigma factor (sigma-70 family)
MPEGGEQPLNSDIISEVYRKYEKQVFFYALSLCKNKQIAEDLTQECFVRAILSLDQTSDRIKIWLFKVCRNLWIDQLRKNKRLADQQECEVADNGASIVETVIIREEMRRTYKAMLSLPANMREILMLNCVLDMPYSEIAEMWGISNGAVRTLLCRARTMLKKKLEATKYEL